MGKRIYREEYYSQNKIRDIFFDLGADYYEDGLFVFKCPVKCNENQLAIAVTENRHLRIGKINPDCDNFEELNSDELYEQEWDWLVEMRVKFDGLIKKCPKSKTKQMK